MLLPCEGGEAAPVSDLEECSVSMQLGRDGVILVVGLFNRVPRLCRFLHDSIQLTALHFGHWIHHNVGI